METNQFNDRLLINCGELVTLSPLVKEKRLINIKREDLGILSNSWIYVRQGRVAQFGKMNDPALDSLRKKLSNAQILDVDGRLVTPGFVDAHTHAIFAGSRAHEFAARLDGETYQSIAARGGGIRTSVRATREASDGALTENLRTHLAHFLSHGVTTVEVKTGYGLNAAQEWRLWNLIHAEAIVSLQTVVPTCLAAHAVMDEFKDARAYLDHLARELLPRIAKKFPGAYVDGFVECGYFEPDIIDAYFSEAKRQGLQIRIHADEFADSGAAFAAAKWNAHSADHLECASDEGLSAMAEKKIVGILLPGTSLYTKIPYAEAERLRRFEVPMGLSTDFNPGSCMIDNISLIASLGAVHCGMSTSEALAAVTYIPAYSLRLHERKGALDVGHDADICVHDFTSVDEWIAAFGRKKPKMVFTSRLI